MGECNTARFDASALTGLAAACFEHGGLPASDARMVADTLITANLRGLDTHGVVRILAYLKRLGTGRINATPDIKVSSPMPFSTVVDADNAMGPVGAWAAMKACEAAAERVGIGAATVRHSNHFGAASIYTVPAAAKGCIAIAMSPASRSLAPHGSRAPLLGTNPFAVAAPAGRHPAWSLDIAASVAARGHVRLAAQEGKPIPLGWALDAEGHQTTDPQAALSGTMLPFSGAKGSGLAMMVDIMGGVLSGAGFAGDIHDWTLDSGSAPSGVGHFFLVMKIEAFMPLGEFEQRMDTAIARLKALPEAEGFSEVMYPGERSGQCAINRRRDGIPLSGAVVTSLKDLATSFGIGFPDPL